ncbi:hypothetical protein FHS94_001590 [Sphingomonas aerophila]|uniref:Uncharacterized protein n=2 Tax=Sphingomonas aerophila TaxID=1344948 RepID=A0A7W9EU06_9SPHN|nr:hypothetical protein [Sphingomonas aerophila]
MSVARMMGLDTAGKMLGGHERLGDALAIQPRSLRAKLAGDRGISAADLIATAEALDARADRVREHARKLREEAGQ